MKASLIILSLSLVSCAGLMGPKKLSFPKKAQIETMISDGQYEAAAKELEGAEIDSFWGGKLLEKISFQRGVGPLGYSGNHQPVCEEKMTRQILAGSATPSATAVYNYTVAPCPDLAKAVIDKADRKALDEGTRRILDFAQQVIVRQNQLASEELNKGEQASLNYLQSMVPTLNHLKGKSGSEASTIANTIEAIEGLAGKRKFFASKEGQDSLAMSDICSKYREKNRLEALIADERAKGKVSGYVNVYKLKTWGDELHNVVGELNNSLGNYRKVTGKKFSNFKGCE